MYILTKLLIVAQIFYTNPLASNNLLFNNRRTIIKIDEADIVKAAKDMLDFFRSLQYDEYMENKSLIEELSSNNIDFINNSSDIFLLNLLAQGYNTNNIYPQNLFNYIIKNGLSKKLKLDVSNLMALVKSFFVQYLESAKKLSDMCGNKCNGLKNGFDFFYITYLIYGNYNYIESRLEDFNKYCSNSAKSI